MNRAYEQVEAEIRKEKAEALGRAGERLEQALQELSAIRREVLRIFRHAGCIGRFQSNQVAAEVTQKLAEYARLRARASQLRHYLIVQREALGLLRHEDVDRCYPIPGPIPGSISSSMTVGMILQEEDIR
jgi:uncharacterized protein YydD (DUF2326 family)